MKNRLHFGFKVESLQPSGQPDPQQSELLIPSDLLCPSGSLPPLPVKENNCLTTSGSKSYTDSLSVPSQNPPIDSASTPAAPLFALTRLVCLLYNFLGNVKRLLLITDSPFLVDQSIRLNNITPSLISITRLHRSYGLFRPCVPASVLSPL